MCPFILEILAALENIIWDQPFEFLEDKMECSGSGLMTAVRVPRMTLRKHVHAIHRMRFSK